MTKTRKLKKILTGLARDLTLKLIVIILVGDFLFSLTGYLGGWSWLCELTSHFRAQYLLIALACAIGCYFFRARRHLIAALLCVLINAVVVAPWYLPPSLFESRPRAHNFRVLLSNVLWKNKNHAALIELIRAENPDLFILQEAGLEWVNAMKPLADAYPHVQTAREHDGQIGCFSRYELENALAEAGIDDKAQTLIARLNFNGRRVSLISLHPPPPVSVMDFEERNRQLVRTALIARRLPQPLILIGDLNATMWTPYFTELVETSGLQAARKGFGVLPTWPVLMRPLMIPIDHCLVSRDIAVVSCRTGSRISSDHLPLIVDLLIPEDRSNGRAN